MVSTRGSFVGAFSEIVPPRLGFALGLMWCKNGFQPPSPAGRLPGDQQVTDVDAVP